ncbi:MAG: DUF2157 domain-containing protein [Gemmataceae bacterium]|nr:DUF2157 domain-containing protein [Gemmataceae bacterium]
MMKRPIQQQQRSWLEWQSRDWAQRGVISSEQGLAILNLYETSETLGEKRRSFAFFSLVAISCLLASAALLLIIGYNWDYLPQAAKLGVIFGVTAGVQAAAFHLTINKGFVYLGESLTFLGCLCYGAAIWLIAQIFNLNAHYPDGFWWWAVGIIPLAFLGKTSLVWALAVFIQACWVGSEAFGDFNRSWFLFGFRVPIPYATWSYLLLAAPGFFWAYWKNSPVAMVLQLSGLYWWLLTLLVRFHDFCNPIFALSAVGVLFWLAGLCHFRQVQIGAAYRTLGFLITWCFFTFFGFHEAQREILRPWARNFDSQEALLKTLVGLLAGLAGSFLFWQGFTRLRRLPPEEQERRPREHFLALALLAFVALFPGHLALACLFPEFKFFIPISTLAANALMVMLSAWLLEEGIHRDNALFFFAGVASFLAWTIQRYIDLFGEFGGMLGAAGLFFLSALALLGVAIFWRKRKGARNVITG